MASTLYFLYLCTRNDEIMLVLQGDTRVADVLVTEFMRLFNQCIKPRPDCAQGHGRKCKSGSRRRFEPASAGSNADCHDIHAPAYFGACVVAESAHLNPHSPPSFGFFSSPIFEGWLS